MDMRDVILTQGEQITKSLEANKDVKVEGRIDSIVLAGMGGSGHPGDLLNALNLPTVPLTVHRDYDLPKIHSDNPLVIASSYSGNTEEVMASYRTAQASGYPLLINTSGGTLEEWSKKDGTPLSKIDFPGMQPRHTLLASFTGIYQALKNSGLVDDVTEDLLRVSSLLDKKIPSLEETGKQLGKKLKGKVPVFTSSTTLGFVAKNFKIQTNENAKAPAFWNTFPELNHNELLGFSKLQEQNNPALFHVTMLRDDDDHERNCARMDVTAELYRKWGIEVEMLPVEGETLLEKMFVAASLGLWFTYYLAQAYNIDPVPVEGVESFKAKLKEVAGEI